MKYVVILLLLSFVSTCIGTPGDVSKNETQPNKPVTNVKEDINVNNSSEPIPNVTIIPDSTNITTTPASNVTTQPTIPTPPPTNATIPITSSTVPPTTTNATTPSTPTTPTTPTTIPTSKTTTSVPPPPPTPSPTNHTTTSIPIPSSTTKPVEPTTTAAPDHRRFDGPSFVGGIVLALGLVAIGFVAYKFYKARTELNYHTL